ncbi:MAG: TolC family protein, partial [Acidobacteria bacterium]|nr:TolC family protein [Acidobacteriota bacterium]
LDAGSATNANLQAVSELVNSPGDHEMALGYSHTVELGEKRERRLDVSRLGIGIARLEIADRERLLRADVKTRFGEALAGARNLAAAEQLSELTRQSYRIAEARTREGEGTPLEEGLLKVELNRIESDRLLFANQMDRAILDLKTLAGMDGEGPVKLSGALAVPELAVSLAQAVSRALQERPDLKTARLEEQLGGAELRLARTEAIPNLVATGRFAHSAMLFDQLGLAAPGGPTVPIQRSDNQLTAGISINLPARNRNQGNIQSAVARSTAASLRLRYLEQVIRHEVEAGHSRYATARRALKIFDEGVLGQSQENLRVLRAAYDLGELRILDVINEQRRLVETQRAYTDLLREGWLAAVDLEKAVGAPLF